MAKSIEIGNSYKLEILQSDLKAISETQKDKFKRRIIFLKEQSSIATELGIETNKLDATALSQNSQNQI